MHIGGEALLNDGAAIVFFSIFSARYLYELGIPGVGENIDLARGVSIFFQKSFGGFAVGIIFGSALLFILTRLNHRFSREENVVEVLSTLAIAYIGYYVADEPVLETSGVIATLTAGLLVKFLGRAVINDAKLLDDFWTLLEHLLNTILVSQFLMFYANLYDKAHIHRRRSFYSLRLVEASLVRLLRSEPLQDKDISRHKTGDTYSYFTSCSTSFASFFLLSTILSPVELVSKPTSGKLFFRFMAV